MSSVAQKHTQPSAQGPGNGRDSSATSENVGKVAPSTPPVRRKSSATPHASSTRKSTTSKGSDKNSRTKKRRKVNHACVYCQRSHMTCDQQRPCSRCIKRSIGHLCHDEPREGQKKNDKLEADRTTDLVPVDRPETANTGLTTEPQQQHGRADDSLEVASASLPGPIAGETSQLGQAAPNDPLPSLNQNYLSYDDWPSAQDPFADLSNPFNPNYMFNSSELTNEYNLLNDFLNSSLLDETLYQGDNNQQTTQDSDPSASTNMASAMSNSNMFAVSPAPNQNGLQMPVPPGTATPRAPTNTSAEKKKEAYYLTAADPGGTDPPEERMNKLLQAKIDAGLLRPFNYASAWGNLNEWMSTHIQPASKQRITQQFDKFRPNFRERTKNLTDVQLTQVEMWFERKLMEYDRVFASMAIPACCWRRTGGIHRGNREMAELLKISRIEELRDGKTRLQDIMTEGSLVDYWERFTTIAFDAGQKAVLTECTLRAQTGKGQFRCCFSFTVVRDPHQVPALIVGNFLPVPSSPQKSR